VLLCRSKKSFKKVFLREMERLGKSKSTGSSRKNNPQKPSLNEVSRISVVTPNGAQLTTVIDLGGRKQ
jgi:hypothetical protein